MNKTKIRWSCLILSLAVLISSVSYLMTDSRAETNTGAGDTEQDLWGAVEVTDVTVTEQDSFTLDPIGAVITTSEAELTDDVSDKTIGITQTISVTGTNAPSDVDYAFIIDKKGYGTDALGALSDYIALLESCGALDGAFDEAPDSTTDEAPDGSTDETPDGASVDIIIVDSNAGAAGTAASVAFASSDYPGVDAFTAAVAQEMASATLAQFDENAIETLIRSLADGKAADRKLMIVSLVCTDDGNDWYTSLAPVAASADRNAPMTVRKEDNTAYEGVYFAKPILVDSTAEAQTARMHAENDLEALSGAAYNAVTEIVIDAGWAEPFTVPETNGTKKVEVTVDMNNRDFSAEAAVDTEGTDITVTVPLFSLCTYSIQVKYDIVPIADGYTPVDKDAPETKPVRGDISVTAKRDGAEDVVTDETFDPGVPTADIARAGLSFSREYGVLSAQSGELRAIESAVPGDVIVYRTVVESIGNLPVSGLKLTDTALRSDDVSSVAMDPAGADIDRTAGEIVYPDTQQLDYGEKATLTYSFTVPATLTDYANGLDYFFETTATAQASGINGSVELNDKLTLRAAVTSDSDVSGTDVSGTDVSGTDVSGTDVSGTDVNKPGAANPDDIINDSGNDSTTNNNSTNDSTKHDGKGAKTDDDGIGATVAIALTVVSGVVMSASTYAIIKDRRMRRLIEAKRR